MNTYTLKELSQELGISQNRLVPKWREMEPVDGHIIYMDEIDGEKCWWLVPIEQHEAGEIVVDGETYTRDEIEKGMHLVDEAPEGTYAPPHPAGFGPDAPGPPDGHPQAVGDEVSEKIAEAKTIILDEHHVQANITNIIPLEKLKVWTPEKIAEEWGRQYEADGQDGMPVDEFLMEPTKGVEPAEPINPLAQAKARIKDGADWREERDQLDEDQAAELTEWMAETGRDMSPEGVNEAPELTFAWLKAIDGIGKTTVEDILAEGYTTFAELQDQLENGKLPGIGEKNGQNLRQALAEELGAPDLAEKRVDLFDAIVEHLGDNDAAIDIACNRVKDGAHDHQLTDSSCNLETVAKCAAEYAVSQTVKERLDDEAIPIICPFCDGLFDKTGPGMYDSAFTLCESGEDDSRGDCGKNFWLEASPDGYATYKSMPEGALADGNNSENISGSEKENPEPEPEDKPDQPRGPIKSGPTCHVCGETIVGEADSHQESDEDGNVVEVQYFHRDPNKCSREAVEGDVADQTEEVSELVSDGGETDQKEAVAEAPIDTHDEDFEELPAAPKPNPFGSPPKTKVFKSPFGKPKKKDKPALAPPEERPHPVLRGCRSVGIAEHGTDEWHALRAKGIGSSDVGALLGLSPHATALDVWKTKVGEETDNKPWLEEYADFGTWMEPYIREWCEAEHGIEIIDGASLGTLQSARWKHAQANIDGLDVTGGVVEEYKTTTEKWSEIPLHYEAQCRQQMLVCDVPEVRLRQFVCPIDRKLVPSLREEMRALDPENADQRLANWLLDKGEMHTWIVERNESYIDRMLERQKKFWGFVEMEVPPTEADPEGTLDLTDEPEVYAAAVEYARVDILYEQRVQAFLDEEGVEVSTRGSVSGTAKKLRKSVKSKLRKAIDRAVALKADDDARPKRVQIGDHHATYIDKGTHAYWRIYRKGSDDVINF